MIDTNRAWCAKMRLLAKLFPRAKVVACVRHMPWIADSFERLTRRNALEPSGLFRFEPGATVYSRFNALTGSDGAVCGAFDSLREAYWSEQAGSLMLLTYQTLTHEPARALAAMYEFLGLPMASHRPVGSAEPCARACSAPDPNDGRHRTLPAPPRIGWAAKNDSSRPGISFLRNTASPEASASCA